MDPEYKTAMIERVLTSGHVFSTKLICIRAILDGDYGPLPRGQALVELGRRVGTSRHTAFRAANDLAGATLASLFGEAENRMDGRLLPSRMQSAGGMGDG